MKKLKHEHTKIATVSTESVIYYIIGIISNPCVADINIKDF